MDDQSRAIERVALARPACLPARRSRSDINAATDISIVKAVIYIGGKLTLDLMGS